MPMVDAAMRRAGLPPAALDLVAATVGPGSFTGIRVGLAAARGMTMIEVVVAIGILAMVGVLIHGTIDSLSRGKKGEGLRAERAVAIHVLDVVFERGVAVVDEIAF